MMLERLHANDHASAKAGRRQELLSLWRRSGRRVMELPHEAVLLRIFTNTGDRCGLEPLYLAILQRARRERLAGATVLRGSLGFGRSARLHQEHLFPIAQDLPVVIEIVDARDRINRFLPVLDEMMESGLVTLERAQVLQVRSPPHGTSRPHPPTVRRPSSSDGAPRRLTRTSCQSRHGGQAGGGGNSGPILARGLAWTKSRRAMRPRLGSRRTVRQESWRDPTGESPVRA